MSASSAPNNRKSQRVDFSRGVDVQIVAIDGTWFRDCRMTDASNGGAKLNVDGSIVGLSKEFFLLLSTTGAAYRRCELAWVNGDQIGVRFISRKQN
ncbi:PilZ domain-containing protein [uncultured Bradyrhizobium sp.]|jgi:hypothetical protein|uniref:PilZ domain-containing protein n=1 Tax=uncultured Bradyrhizobium sp. TaxID=199684 RepID=UPI002629B106|nr:PilZ domain-containing protein [uncultured Bradyrhizobium sp.]